MHGGGDGDGDGYGDGDNTFMKKQVLWSFIFYQVLPQEEVQDLLAQNQDENIRNDWVLINMER